MLTCEQEHLSRSLPAILGGLADEAEGVREAALAAGRTLVELYAETALPLLLPAVEDGIVNANWRIRQSSAELLGDLLFKVLLLRFMYSVLSNTIHSGVTGRMSFRGWMLKGKQDPICIILLVAHSRDTL